MTKSSVGFSLRRKALFFIIFTLLAGILIFSISSRAQLRAAASAQAECVTCYSQKPPLSPSLFARGEALYQKQCAACHGVQGTGDGKAAYLLYPKPRDFTRNEFRLVSTTDRVPTDEDLFKTLSRGMPGSAMPSWAFLPEEDRWALVYYTRYLAEPKGAGERGEVRQPAPESVLQVPQEPPVGPEALQRGRELFVKGCAACHGLEGKGDGQQVMMDSLGFPLRPRDLTSGLFKGSSTSEELYYRLALGIPGTPMPSYKDAFTQEQIWDLVHYIQTLSPEGAEERLRLRRHQIVAKKVTGAISMDPLAPEWQAVEPTFVALTPLWWRNRRIEGVEVKALHNGIQLALSLAWRDETEDKSMARPQLFSDGAAVQFSLEKDPPFFGMGDSKAPVHIWHWKASWQEESKRWEDIETVYPHAAIDWYPADTRYTRGQPFEVSASDSRFHDPLYMSAWGASNPLAYSEKKSSLEEAQAQGLGTLTSKKHQTPPGEASGLWRDGTWQLVFLREMSAGESKDIRFAPGDGVNAAFAVWDGSATDRDGQKNVSIWNELVLET